MKKRAFSELERLFLVSVITLGVSACGQVALKRGADGGDFAATKAACESEREAYPSVDACLADQGWVVYDREKTSARASLNRPDAGDVDPLANTNRSSSLEAASAQDGRIPAPTTNNSNMAEGVKEESGSFLSGISVSKTDNRPGVVAPAPATPSVRNRSTEAPSSARPKYKDTDILQVASWWKWGGNGEALIADGTACKAAIGETAEASYNFSTLSVSVLKCLEKKGWRYLLAEQQ